MEVDAHYLAKAAAYHRASKSAYMIRISRPSVCGGKIFGIHLCEIRVYRLNPKRHEDELRRIPIFTGQGCLSLPSWQLPTIRAVNVAFWTLRPSQETYLDKLIRLVAM